MEGSGFWVKCPELNVVSQGETVEESLNMIAEAVELHLEEAEGTQGEPHSGYYAAHRQNR